MLTFIFGGSASGKSEYAEQYAASLAHNCNAPLLYLATMCANDTESKQRIERHRRMRADKSFQTMEVSKEIGSIVVESDSVVLLECLSNLLANEMFSSKSTLKPIKHIQVIKSYLIKEHLTVKWFDNRLSSKSTLKPIKRILVIKSYLIKEHLTIK